MRYEESISDPYNVCPIAELRDGHHVCTMSNITVSIVNDCTNHRWLTRCEPAKAEMKRRGIWKEEWGR